MSPLVNYKGEEEEGKKRRRGTILPTHPEPDETQLIEGGEGGEKGKFRNASFVPMEICRTRGKKKRRKKEEKGEKVLVPAFTPNLFTPGFAGHKPIL